MEKPILSYGEQLLDQDVKTLEGVAGSFLTDGTD